MVQIKRIVRVTHKDSTWFTKNHNVSITSKGKANKLYSMWGERKIQNTIRRSEGAYYI